MEEMKKTGETTSSSSPTATSNQSVTSPIFNSMAVVSTSTPSSSDKENSTPTPTIVDLNHTTNSIKKSEMAASNMMMMSNNNKIELNIQNSRPLISRENHNSRNGTHSGNGTTTTLVNGINGSSGASTLKLFIKKQDYSVQVADRAGQYTIGANRGGPRFTQSPNGNTFGRSKKSIDLVASEESKGIFQYHCAYCTFFLYIY